MEAFLHGGHGFGLLAFSHGYSLERVFLLLLGQFFDVGSRVRTSGQEEEDGFLVRTALPDGFDWVGNGAGEFLAQSVQDEVRATHQSSVLSQGTDEADLQETAHILFGLDTFLEVRNRVVLGVVLVDPLFPLGFIATHRVGHIAEECKRILAEVVTRECDHVEPDLIAHPSERLGAFTLDVQGRTALQENVHVAVGQFFSGDQDLEANHQDISNLVTLEETTIDVLVDMEGQVFDDLLHTLGRLLLLLGQVNGLVEEFEELFEGGVVHPGDQRHINDTEVHRRATNGHGAILFSLLIDFLGLDFGIGQFNGHILGLCLGQVQHVHQLCVVQ